MKVTHGGNVWQGARPDQWLDFSANLNPEGPPEWVRSAMEEGLSRAAYYPDLRERAARRGMSAFLKLPEECVLVTSGGIEAAALTAVLGRNHAIAQPTFQEYGHLCAESRSVSREALEDYTPRAGERLWLCNPNNPTGDALRRQEVLRLLDRVEAAGAYLAVDEAFIEYCPEESVVDLVADHPALTVLGSLTKALSIPGIRLGYLAAHPSVIAKIEPQLPPWRINCVADTVAAALPGHEADFAALRRLNDVRREAFATDLRALGIKVYPSNANFLLCDFGRDMRPDIEALKEKHILVRPCGMFPRLNDGHVRLCVRTEEENRQLIETLYPLSPI